MPEYLDDPSVLTKDKLKNELLANNVELPSANSPKDVYVQLYLKNLTAKNTRNVSSLDGFSSDEELPPPVVHHTSRSSGRKAIRKTDKVQSEGLDVAELTTEGLKDELMKFGVEAGPIVASTRRVYEKKLLRLLEESTSPATPDLPPVQTEMEANHNGHADSDQFSDKEEEEARGIPEPEPEVIPEPEPLPEPIPLVERLVRSRGKTPITTRTRSSQHNKVEKVVAQSPKAQERDILKEVFANDLSSPTGIIASCRKPIRGAAGRPIQPSDFWNDENLLLSPKSLSTTTTTTSTYSETRHRSSNLALPPPSSSIASPASRLVSAAPPAVQTKAARRGLSVWLKLFILALLVSFLFFVYQTMEVEVLSPFSSSKTEQTSTKA